MIAHLRCVAYSKLYDKHGANLIFVENFFLPTLQTHPCNENRVFLV